MDDLQYLQYKKHTLIQHTLIVLNLIINGLPSIHVLY